MGQFYKAETSSGQAETGPVSELNPALAGHLLDTHRVPPADFVCSIGQPGT
jgi:hypothetical protein